MIKSLDQVDDKVKENIFDDYILNSYSLSELTESYQLSKNEILAILGILISPENLMNEAAIFDVFNEPIMFISDTHICSKLEDITYLEMAYEFASRNGIKHILHGGDLLQGSYSPLKKKMGNPLYQAERCAELYPQKDGIKTHIVLGNHDYKIITKNESVLKIMQSRGDFDIMGFHRAYFSWCNHLFSVKHEIEKYKAKVPRLEETLKFVGHSHNFKIKDNHIFLPTLSNDIKHDIETNKPGWLVMKLIDGELCINHYVIDQDYQIYDEGICYSKKLTNEGLLKR